MAPTDTPRTDVGNGTLMTHGFKGEQFDVDESYLSPVKRKKGKDDLLSQMRDGRGAVPLRTPRARVPLADRRNIPALAARQEFTPLLQSVTKKNLERSGISNKVPATPAFLRGSQQGIDTPGLPAAEASVLYGSYLASSVLGDNGSTPVPEISSSTAQSTPLAVLPKRDGAGMLNEQGNLMTLREQENIIDRVEKENFGLKLKIHFLEESLGKTGPGLNEAALKENTDLKVDRITLQKELARCRKLLTQAEKDVESLRQLVKEGQQRAHTKQADLQIRKDLETLTDQLSVKEKQVDELRATIRDSEASSDGIEKLKSQIEDLEIDLREKDRVIDDRDDEIDILRTSADEKVRAVEEELAEAKRQVEELEDNQDEVAASAADVKEAKEALEEAEAARQRAEDDLNELRDEMANKSINTRGLGRQLEEQVKKLDSSLSELRSKHQDLQENLDEKVRDNRRLEEQLENQAMDADSSDQRLRDRNELLEDENENLKRRLETANRQTTAMEDELQQTKEEADLLHSRHDALTVESQQLQKDLTRTRSSNQQLQTQLDAEKQHALDNEYRLQEEARSERDRLLDEVEEIRREKSSVDSHAEAEKDLWESQKRSLEAQKEKALEHAAGLQRTVDALHKTEGSMSDRETHLQQALESEKDRYNKDKSLLEQQVKDLGMELDEKRSQVTQSRHDLVVAQEDLSKLHREKSQWADKVQALEDEIEVLQSSIDDEADRAQHEIDEANDRVGALQAELLAAQDGRADNDKEGGETMRLLRSEIAAARRKELDFIQGEQASKETVQALRRDVDRLEREAHETQLARLTGTSPRSPRGSPQTKQITGLRQQLIDSQQQLKDTRSRLTKDLDSAQKRLLESNESVQRLEEVQEQLESELNEGRQTQEALQAQNSASDAIIARLRKRLDQLEKDMHQNRRQARDDNTIAEERKDLHVLLKEAKLEAEDLRVQLSSKEPLIAKATSRENVVRGHLRRVRGDRAKLEQRSNTLAQELGHLQHLHDQTVDEFAKQQRSWAKEHQKLQSRVRFPHNSISDLYEEGDKDGSGFNKKHARELHGLAKHIQWLKAKCRREEDFRSRLAYEKRFLLMRIGMFEACNATDLQLLTELGVSSSTPESVTSMRLRLGDAAIRKSAQDSKVGRKPLTIRVVALAIMAQVRMKRMADEWAVNKDIKEALARKLETMRSGNRRWR